MEMPSDEPHYVIALGSNRPGRHGRPGAELAAALGAIGGVRVASRVMTSAPVGPSIRRFANQVAIIESEDRPVELLARLKAIEAAFGRRPGQRWGSRVIDLDIILWSKGIWADRGLTVPHVAFRDRRFVLDPLRMIAPDWRDPVTGLTIRQLHYRACAVDRMPRPS
ncbi:MAG: 2-amino-4-hydroxy-6-hydroxymethyldihydropteridine diphosphokinase [Proteobacteria bacterium ST_bin13]|nr:MAG: 2-amino-4-hydroxy-6-hydroxymethyldihydropteridine diphosphokinase [Proteobacteria bacterium ST_bin13]